MRPLLRVLLAIPSALACLWAAAAIWFDARLSPWLAGLLAGLILFATAWLLWRTRPFRLACAGCLAFFCAVLAWWLSLAPSNDRAWLADVAQLPRAERDGDRLVLHNVRNFHYRSSDADFEPRWETRHYDLSKLVGLDLYLSEWGAPGIAHTIMAWRFADAPPLAISIETRKEQGESYSAVLGFFRRYELYYVLADERDVIGVRARHRDERVKLFALRADPATARRLLDGYLDDVNALAGEARWYNALTTNCTTVIFANVKHVFGLSRLLDWRVYANAHLPEMLREQGTINSSVPYEELMAVSDVTERVKLASDGEDFSTRIRVGLPSAPQ